MKFKNKIVTLSSIIAVLSLIYMLGVIFSSEKMSEKRSKELLFNQKLQDQVSMISISTEDGIADIVRKGGNWFISIDSEEYPASESKIDNMVDSVFSLTRYQVIGDDSKYWKKFDLEDDKARTVTLKGENGKELLSLFVGKSGPAERGEYIRTSLSQEVFLTDASIQRYFLRDKNYWCNLRILPEEISSSDITAVSVISDVSVKDKKYTGSIDLKKESTEGDYEWVNMDGGKVYDRNTADSLANNISALIGDRFVKDSITNNEIRIEIETDNLGRIIIDIQKKNDDEFLLRKRGDRFTYIISEYKVKRIIGSLES